jgi:hypothetical protein
MLLMEPVLAAVLTANHASDSRQIVSHVLREVDKSILNRETVSAPSDSMKIFLKFAWPVNSNVKNASPVLTVQYVEEIAWVLLVPVRWAISMMELLNSAKDATQDVMAAQETRTHVLLVLIPVDYWAASAHANSASLKIHCLSHARRAASNVQLVLTTKKIVLLAEETVFSPINVNAQI